MARPRKVELFLQGSAGWAGQVKLVTVQLGFSRCRQLDPDLDRRMTLGAMPFMTERRHCPEPCLGCFA